LSRRNPGEDYFADEADLEGSLDLPILGRFEREPRFFQQRAEHLSELIPNPRLSERLYRLVASDPTALWVVGLGAGGEELPVAIGLAAQAAASGRSPTLLAGPELKLPAGAGESGSRPIAPGPLAPVLEMLCPQGCAAQPSGVHGVHRVWAATAQEGDPLEARNMIVVGSWEAESLRPPAGSLSGVVAVVPYRDEPAGAIGERLARLRATGYPLLGMVTVTSSEQVPGAGEAPEVGDGKGSGADDAPGVPGRGGIMDDTTGREEKRTDREGAPPGQTEPENAPTEENEKVRVQQPWSEAYGPGRKTGRCRGGFRMSGWWVLVILLVVVGAAGLIYAWMGGQNQSADEPLAADEIGPLGTEPADLARPSDEGAADRYPPEAAAEESAAEPVDVMRVAEVRAGEVAAAEADEPGAAPAPDPIAVQPDPEPAEPAGVAHMETRVVAPFAILCGSFRDRALAEAEASRLVASGLGARVVTLAIPERGTWHRVVAGSWPDQTTARQHARKAIDSETVTAAMLVAADGYGPAIGPEIE
jgi:hypothetical protein